MNNIVLLIVVANQINVGSIASVFVRLAAYGPERFEFMTTTLCEVYAYYPISELSTDWL
jgi:hypothetical protein